MSRLVEHAPVDASFAVTASGAHVVPSKPGTALDVVASAKALLAAALSPVNRVARLSVVEQQAKRTTADAKAMGITGVVSSYQTYFGGVPNRIHNVQLVAHLVDEQLIRPGENWSFNGATGERSAAKGFLEAPVIINGEVETGLGGGVCQVSTTVFNAAFEAGLPITARTNHALYISHYPLGRDATVNYPNVDLRFTNDTKPLALSAHLRHELLAPGDALRDARPPPGRVHRRAAREHRADPGAEDQGPDAPEGRVGGRRRRARRPRRRASSARSTRRTGSCCTTTCGTRPTAPRRRCSSSAPSRSRRRSRPPGPITPSRPPAPTAQQ